MKATDDEISNGAAIMKIRVDIGKRKLNLLPVPSSVHFRSNSWCIGINNHSSCNPDHVDSYCPNTIAFSGKNPIFAVINRVMHRNNVAKALHNVTEDYKRWCFISFIRCES